MSIAFKIIKGDITTEDIQNKTDCTLVQEGKNFFVKYSGSSGYLDIRECDGIIVQIFFVYGEPIIPVLAELYNKFKIEFISEISYQGVAHGIEKIEDILPGYMESFFKAAGITPS